MYLKASELFNTRIREDGRRFKARFVSKEDVIDIGINSIKIYGGSNSTDNITLGSTISQRVEAEMDRQDISIPGKEWELEIGLLLDSEEDRYEYIPMGLFTPEKPSTDNGKTKFTAYDRMLKLSGIYVCSLSEVNTVTVLNDISRMTGVPIDVTGLIPLPMSVPEGYTYREVLMYIAQKYGKFANVDRDGVIRLHWWTIVPEYEITGSNTRGFSHEERPFILGRITCSTGQDEEGNTFSISAGTGIQGIEISNPFMTQQELDRIYDEVEGFTYTVSEVNMPLGDIRLDPWDIVVVKDGNENSYKVPAMTLEFSYDGGVSASFSCVGYSEEETERDYKGPMQQFQERMLAAVAKIGFLEADKANIKDLKALTLRVDKITSTDITVEYLEANYISAEYAKMHLLTVDTLEAEIAKLKFLEADLSNLDTANIDKANVGILLADVGLLSEATIVDGHVTGYLSGVKINADVIDAGTLSVDRLLVTGKDSIVYQINVDSSGLSAEELEKEVYQKYLNGTDIVANSVTANQIAAESITTSKLVAGAVTTEKIATNAINASKIDVQDLFAQDITATGTISGANLIGATGSFEGSVTADEIYVNTGINFYLNGDKENKIPIKLVRVKSTGYNMGKQYLSLVAGAEEQTAVNNDIVVQPGLTIEGEARVFGNISVTTDASGSSDPGDIWLQKYSIYVGATLNSLKSSVNTVNTGLAALKSNKSLYSGGGLYMNGTQSITLSQGVSAQNTGIVLVWSRYDGGAKNYGWVTHFIPKALVASHSGTGFDCPLCATNNPTVSGGKYVYIDNTTIKGNDYNNKGNNAKWVLRQVIGV